MEQLSPELEELLNSSFKLRKALEQILSKEAVDYILTLIARDGAHRKFLKLTEETDDNERTEDYANKEQNQPVD